MNKNQNSKDKISAADVACSKVHNSLCRTLNLLGGGVSVNGYGIYNNPVQVRQKLLAAQKEISTALQTLDGVDWPTETDYNKI